MQKLSSHFAGLVKNRISEGEWERHARQCENCRPVDPECPRCHGAKFLSRKVKVGVFDYIACDCQTESLRRAREIYSGLAAIMPSQTFGNFIPTPETQAAYQTAREFAETQTDYHILTLHGGVGTGKTHLLQAIGWMSLEQGRQPKFVSVARYLDKLRDSFNDDSPVTFAEVYAPLESAVILLLDDIGAERLTNWGQEQLYKIVNYRYQERLAMAVSMNLNEKQAVDIYGERTASRLLDTDSGRVRVVSTGDWDYRRGLKGRR